LLLAKEQWSSATRQRGPELGETWPVKTY